MGRRGPSRLDLERAAVLAGRERARTEKARGDVRSDWHAEQAARDSGTKSLFAFMRGYDTEWRSGT